VVGLEGVRLVMPDLKFWQEMRATRVGRKIRDGWISKGIDSIMRSIVLCGLYLEGYPEYL
jgi:hypothetical protein